MINIEFIKIIGDLNMTAVNVNDSTTLDQDKLSTFRVEVLDYIPIVSTISGIARAVFGVIQAAVGVVAFPVQLCGRVTNVRSPFILNKGIANVVRGVIAGKPFVGNIILYLYDHSHVTKRDLRRAAGLDL